MKAGLHEVSSELEMIDLGREIARSLGGGEVLALVGELGAGKTHLVKGIVAGLDSGRAVTSPTFTLVHEYRGGRLAVNHFDFYRMENEREVLAIGWDEFLESTGEVAVVEWADKFPGLIPGEAQWWRIEIMGEGRRRLSKEKAP
ncbi:MAG: tRNA (adenosine(37)-N6)-threonylcarbamoyltransferase complex ATPase subunit type 1 TsaE [Verrucomicrobiales bacterium]